MVKKSSSKEFIFWSLSKLSQAIKNKEISPVDVTQALLERIDNIDGHINSFITILHDEALREAKQAEEEIMSGQIKSPLHGIPIGLKDIIFTKGIKTTMGSEIYQDYVPKHNATVVDKLKEAGSIIIGKLNTHQFAYGPTGDRSYFGPVRNPNNLSKMSGGSSSGSAAAVSADLCYGALGTDTSGSIRIPASFCGIVGMKPTSGRVSKYGVFPMSWILDHVGPMTKSVEDNALVLNALIGNDPKDPYSVFKDKEDFTRYLHKGITGTVIGIPSTFYFEQLESEVQQEINKALTIFKELGATIREIDIPDLTKITEAQHVILKSDAYAVHESRLREYPEQWDIEVKERLFTGAEPKAYEYALALQKRHWAINEYNKVFKEVDIIAGPTVAILPPDIEQRELDIDGYKGQHIRWPMIKLTGHANMTGFPSLSLPCAFSSSGLPIGLQLTSKAFDEANLYRFGYAFEEANGYDHLKVSFKKQWFHQ